MFSFGFVTTTSEIKAVINKTNVFKRSQSLTAEKNIRNSQDDATGKETNYFLQVP